MNVLSLFDGMSGGQIALNRAGIKVNQYFASEIDKYAIKVTQANYPNTIQLGDVKQVGWFGLPAVDLLIGGSPCQGFSNAGLGHNFNDPRSALFFEYIRILLETKPRYFLLENVKMKREWQNTISHFLGVEPIKINSALVSAQNRERLYWTNIPGITQPVDKGILLRDIIEDGEVDRNKSLCVLPGMSYRASYNQYMKHKLHQIVLLDNINPSGKGMNGNVYDISGKSPTLTTNKGEGRKIEIDGTHWRKLTPIECERLQTVPDNYTKHVSNSQRYKMLGNGWTVDVIAHIFSFLPHYHKKKVKNAHRL